jgi:hypothetical protein
MEFVEGEKLSERIAQGKDSEPVNAAPEAKKLGEF